MILKYLKNIIRQFSNYYEIQDVKKELDRIKKQLTTTLTISQLQQKQLKFYYQNLLTQNLPLPELSETGFRVFSQTDEDGILHYIFSLIGTTNKVCLEIAFTSPYGSNTTNLILNHGWNSILICETKRQVNRVKQFFTSHSHAWDLSILVNPPVIYSKWITAENINKVIQEGLNDLEIKDKEIDLFSLDIDGMDYWIWKALKIVEPNVVIVEYNHVMGYKSITIPYKPDFKSSFENSYFGASLPAYIKLAKKKGYRLVGVNNLYNNAFFVKNEIGKDILPEISYEKCIQKRWNSLRKKYWDDIKNLEFVQI
ncbi:MAG: hypothetical protein ACFFAH_14955 [Promethearchaeota archaeon]